MIDPLLSPECSEIVMTMSPTDKSKIIREYWYKLQEKYATKDLKEIHKKIIEDFKTKRDPRILIVTDMLITGFDAPTLWAMYLDRPLREHRILQAIARTNRPIPNKKFGLILDYIGILTDLEEAFERFEASEGLRLVITDLEKERLIFKELLEKALRPFEGVEIEDTHESLDKALEQLVDRKRAEEFEKTMKELMRSYEMLQGDPFLKEYLYKYRLLVQIYLYYYKKFYKSKIDELKIENLSKKTTHLIQETIDIKKIEDKYPPIIVDENFIKMLKSSKPKTAGGALDIITSVMYEARTHPTSPFFINLGREVSRIYEELRTRKIETERAMEELLKSAQKVLEWKREEREIGKDIYPLYEAVKNVLPEIEKQEAIDFARRIKEHLEKRGLLFKGWREQREVRRKVRAEIRFLILSRFKDRKDKIDDLQDSIYKSLEETK
jgi:type I restriction enzyme R subunit